MMKPKQPDPPPLTTFLGFDEAIESEIKVWGKYRIECVGVTWKRNLAVPYWWFAENYPVSIYRDPVEESKWHVAIAMKGEDDTKDIINAVYPTFATAVKSASLRVNQILGRKMGGT